jgi:hypothetical protein
MQAKFSWLIRILDVWRPFKHQWNKSAYIQKREDAKREEWESQQHKQYIDAIHAITNQLKTQQQETNTNDSRPKEDRVTAAHGFFSGVNIGIQATLLRFTSVDLNASHCSID